MPTGENIYRCSACLQEKRCGDCIPSVCPECECKQRGHLRIEGTNFCGRCGARPLSTAKRVSESREANMLAGKLLDQPNADPDDDLRMLSRQLLRRNEVIDRLKNDLNAALDPTRDMIHANIEITLKKHEEAVRRVRKSLDLIVEIAGVHGTVWRAANHAVAVLEALNLFHPMHGESWRGWPDEEDKSGS